jgi:hypothetical protein
VGEELEELEETAGTTGNEDVEAEVDVPMTTGQG